MKIKQSCVWISERETFEADNSSSLLSWSNIKLPLASTTHASTTTWLAQYRVPIAPVRHFLNLQVSVGLRGIFTAMIVPWGNMFLLPVGICFWTINGAFFLDTIFAYYLGSSLLCAGSLEREPRKKAFLQLTAPVPAARAMTRTPSAQSFVPEWIDKIHLISPVFKSYIENDNRAVHRLSTE